MNLQQIGFLLLSALLISACSSNKELSLLHDDDVYFAPRKDRQAKNAQTVTQATFVDDNTTAKQALDGGQTNDYYDESVSRSVLQDNPAVTNYYNTIYGADRYNRDRFGWNVGVGYYNYPMGYGVNYGSPGWGNNWMYNSPYGYGYPYNGWGYNGYGWNSYYPYGGWGYGNGGYYCPNYFGGSTFGDGGNFSNTYFGPRPNVGGGTTGNTHISQPVHFNNGVSRNNSNGQMQNTRPSSSNAEAKQPVYYSPERTEGSSSSLRNDSRGGFRKFIQGSAGNVSGTGDNGRQVGGSRSGNQGFRPSGGGSSRPVRSTPAPRSGGTRR